MWAYVAWILSSWGIWLLKKIGWWLLMFGLKWLSRKLIEIAYKMLRKKAQKREEVRCMIKHGQLMVAGNGQTQKDAKRELLRRSSYMFTPTQRAKLDEYIEKEG